MRDSASQTRPAIRSAQDLARSPWNTVRLRGISVVPARLVSHKYILLKSLKSGKMRYLGGFILFCPFLKFGSCVAHNDR